MGRESVDLLEKMLGEMRAEDVRRVKVKEICKMKRGKPFPKTYIEAHPGDYPVYTSQTSNEGEFGRIDTYMYDGEYLTCTTDGYAGVVFYRNGKFNIAHRCMILDVIDKNVDAKFLCYILNTKTKSQVMNPWNIGQLSIERMGEIEIPLPPLEIQKLIGENLWLMEQNLKNIKKELEIRRGQFEFYRDVVVGLDKEYLPDDVIEMIKKMCPNGVERKKLGEIGKEIFRGNGITKKDLKRELDDGEKLLPCVRYAEIYTTYNTWFDECVSYIGENAVKNKKYFEHGDLLFAISSVQKDNLGKSCVYVGNEKCVAGGDMIVMKHDQNPKYMSLALDTSDAWKQKLFGKTAHLICHLSADEISKIEIPLPPLEVQQMIVEILEPFEGICRDLKKAEKIMRGKFEFCRDEILKF